MKTEEYNHRYFIEAIKQLVEDLHFWHLETLSYAQHKALDKSHKNLSAYVDPLAEQLIGKFGKLGHINIESPSCDIEDLPQCIEEFALKLRDFSSKHSIQGILNMSDEIFNVGSTLRYLLRLK